MIAHRVIILVMAMAVLLSLLASCDTTVQENLDKRLANFRQLLPEEVRNDFDNGNYDAVATAVDAKLKSDPEFDAAWEKTKKDEAIGMFTTIEVIRFFGENFKNFRKNH